MMSRLVSRVTLPVPQFFLISVLLGLGLLLIRAAGVFQPAELLLYDWNLGRHASESLENPPTVIIAITEEDIQKQQQYPFTDEALAKILDTILSYQPKAIGLDIYRDIEVPPGQQDLVNIFSANPHIIGVMKEGGGGQSGIRPPTPLQGTEQVGFTDIIVDPDGIVRRGLLYQDGESRPVPSLALQLALVFLKEEGVLPKPDPRHPEYLRVGRSTLTPYQLRDGGYIEADDRGYQVFLDYREGRNPAPQYSLGDLLEGRLDLPLLKGKIVLLGVMAASVPDLFHSPVKQFMAGVELHAALANQLVRAARGNHNPIAPVGRLWEWMIIIGICLLGGGVGLWVKSVWKFVVANVIFLCAFILIGIILFSQGYWLPEVSSAVGFILSGSAVVAFVLGREGEDRKVLEQLFFRFVSPEVAQSLWEKRSQFLDGRRPRSQKMTVTVLFMDLQGYSSAAEQMTPSQLMDWVNSYLEEMATCIIQYGGVIDDYAGDGIKANFGVPIPRTGEVAIQQEAEKSVGCALAMVEKFLQLKQLHEEQGHPSVGLRIGIATGFVVAGSLGSSQRLKYTTVGDTVNVASRLESLSTDRIPLCLTFRYRILLDQTTFSYLSQDFATHEIGEIRVKGRQQAVTAFQLTYRPDDRPAFTLSV